MVSKILAGRLAALAAPKGKVSIAATFFVTPRSIQRTRATTRVLASMCSSLVGGSNRWSATTVPPDRIGRCSPYSSKLHKRPSRVPAKATRYLRSRTFSNYMLRQ
jgi:hypothetical protein